MYLLNAGIIAKFLSPTVVHGFTFGVALQVFSSQFPSALGITVSRAAFTSNYGVAVQVFIFVGFYILAFYLCF